MGKTLFFFTASFPYGRSESFIENEIEHLARNFKKVYILPASKEKEIREIPENCELIDIEYSDQNYSRAKVLKRYPILLYRFYKSELNFQGSNIKNKKTLFSKCLRTFHKAIELEDKLQKYEINEGVFYTYWMDNWTTLLSILKAAKKISNFLTRAHGFDLYEERKPENYIPFRAFQMLYCDIVSVISQHGVDYLKSKYPMFKFKISLDYLGTSDHGFNDAVIDEKISLVSISNIVEIKRIALIVELLKQIETPVKWTHYGDGKLMKDICNKIEKLPARHTVDLKGRIPNQEVLEFLKTTPINFLINVSSSEGLPVSIMEAISFGIPIIATDVGGTNEIVNDKTGFLIEKIFDVNILAMEIQNVLNSRFGDQGFRKGVRSYWKEKFSAENNYTKFIKKLKEI